MSHTQSFLTKTGLLLVCIALTSCASYVNIPPDGKDTALNAVNLPPAPAVMAEALAHAVTLDCSLGSPHITLPENASPKTYQRAETRAESAIASALALTSNTDQPTTFSTSSAPYSVLEVHIRSKLALVDVLLPDTFAPRRLLRVRMRGHFNGWHLVSLTRFVPSEYDLQRADNLKHWLEQPIIESQPEPQPVETQPAESPDDSYIREVRDTQSESTPPIETQHEPEIQPYYQNGSIQEVTNESKVEPIIESQDDVESKTDTLHPVTIK